MKCSLIRDESRIEFRLSFKRQNSKIQTSVFESDLERLSLKLQRTIATCSSSRRAKDSLLILSNASKMLPRKDAPRGSIFDALDRIQSDSFARLDAAKNIVPTIHRFASSERVEGDD